MVRHTESVLFVLYAQDMVADKHLSVIMHVRIGRYASEEDDLETFERDEEIIIHNYDTWSMDHTLALIIVPMLKQLKETKHGAPNVDCIDVPLRLKPTQMEISRYKEDGTTDKNFFRRWDYVLDEMIWAFEQIAADDDEEQFYSGECDIKWTPVDEDGNEVSEGASKYSRMDRGPNDTFKVDREGLEAHHKRIDNGTRLFGKYYRSLWD